MSYSNLFATVDYSDYNSYKAAVNCIKDALRKEAAKTYALSKEDFNLDTHEAYMRACAVENIAIAALRLSTEIYPLCVKAQSLLPLYVAAIESLKNSSPTFMSASADIIKAAAPAPAPAPAPVLTAPTPAPAPTAPTSTVTTMIAVSRVETAQVLEAALTASRARSAATLAAALVASRAATAAVLAKYSM